MSEIFNSEEMRLFEHEAIFKKKFLLFYAESWQASF